MTATPDTEQIAAKDIEQADQGERPSTNVRIEPLIDQKGGQVRADKGDVETTNKESAIQQPIVPMPTRHAKRATERQCTLDDGNTLPLFSR